MNVELVLKNGINMFEIVNTTNVEIVGLTISETYPTHMFPHEVPSGGDWAVHRLV